MNTDETPIEWTESDAERRDKYNLRFLAALDPLEDLGATNELHQAEIARRVFAIHAELNAAGKEAYSAVWATLPWVSREAIRKYVEIAKEQS